MPQKIDYSTDFIAFFRDMYVVEGAFGPKPIIPLFLEAWLKAAFPHGNPAARNILDARTKKEGKSALAGAVGLYMASRKPYQEVVIVAADQDQSRDRVLRAIKFGVEHGPLAAHAKVFKDVIQLDNSSIIQAMPSDWRGAAGGNYSAVIFDELHSWVYESNRRLFDELVIPPTQPDGVRWIASYAGWEGESVLLREWWDKALAGERMLGELPIYKNDEANLLAFIDTGPESWRMPWMTQEYIKQTQASERPNTFRRIWLNEWVANESQFLPEGAWEACFSKDVKPLAPKDKRCVVLGADASTSRDFTALVGVEYNRPTNTTDVIFCRVWKPQRGILRMGKPTIDLAETIGKEVKRLHEARQVEAIIADPYQLHGLIIEWQKMGIQVIELAQNAGRVEADQSLYDAVLARSIRHYSDPTLNEHIKNAIAMESVRGFRLAKEKTSQKIDAAVALSMAHYGALETQKAGGEASSLPNLFYDWEGTSLDDHLKIHDKWAYLPGANRDAHKPGITWRNCKHRNKGCLACIAELEAEGEYERQELEAKASLARWAGEPMTEEEGYRYFLEQTGQLNRYFEDKRRSENEFKIIRRFKQAARNRLA